MKKTILKIELVNDSDGNQVFGAVIDEGAKAVPSIPKSAGYFGLSTKSTRSENSRALSDIVEANKNGELFLIDMLDGDYKVHDPVSLHGVNGIQFRAKGRANFITDAPTGVFFTADEENRVNGVMTENIGFVCTHKAKLNEFHSNKHPGIIFFGIGQASNLYFKNPYFSAPNCNMNGLKITNETLKGAIANGGKIRFTKNLNIEGALFENMGRMGIELWGDYADVRDPSLFNVSITDTTFDNIGTVNTAEGIGMSIATVGSGLYTNNIRLKNIGVVGIETVDINNASHNNILFKHSANGRGRAFGTSDRSPMRNMQINGWKETGVPPKEMKDENTSYFQNARNLTISNAELLQGLLIGSEQKGQYVENFKIENSTIKAKDAYGIIQFRGDVRGGEINDCDLSNDSENPSLVTLGKGVKDVKMNGGSVTKKNKWVSVQQNAGGGKAIELNRVETKNLE